MYSPTLTIASKTKQNWIAGFSPRSLSSSAHREAIQSILLAALEAVNPALAVERSARLVGEQLDVQGKEFDLRDVERIFVVAIGKAGLPMTRAMATILGERLTWGIVLVKDNGEDGYEFDDLQGRIRLYAGGHPLPDERGHQAARQIEGLVAEATSNDLVIPLISGGGSALLTSPVEGVSLQEMQYLTESLLACGATIFEINILRKHLERLKGGRLAQIASPARVISLVLSDVVGNSMETIASGPTVPDSSTYLQALHVLEHYHLMDEVPASITRYLKKGAAGEIPETPKPGDELFERVSNFIIGGNRQACQSALDQAARHGLNTLLLTTYLQGEARQAGGFMAAIAREIDVSQKPIPRPACLVAGGETTVNIIGDGLGGRNLEVALGAVRDLSGLQEVVLLTLATDGGDGPTDAAGAVVTGETLGRAIELGLDPDETLKRNDSYHFFEALNDLLKPGPTHTNVNDLTFLFAF